MRRDRTASEAVVCCSGKVVLSPWWVVRSSSPVYALYVLVLVLQLGPAWEPTTQAVGPAACLLCVLMNIASIAFLAAVVMSDPGILPRHALREAAAAGLLAPEDEATIAKAAVNRFRSIDPFYPIEWPETLAGGRFAAPEAIAALSERSVQVLQGSVPPVDADSPLPPPGRICTSCLTIRPADCHHCSVTGRCVAGFDHYCGVLGKAIGRGNHRMFVMLVSLTGYGGALLSVIHGVTLGFHLPRILAAAGVDSDPQLLWANPWALTLWIAAAVVAMCSICFCCGSAGLSMVFGAPVVALLAGAALVVGVPSTLSMLPSVFLCASLALLSIPLMAFCCFNLDIACRGDSMKARIKRKKSSTEDPAAVTSMASSGIITDGEESDIHPIVWRFCYCCLWLPGQSFSKHLRQWDPRSYRAFWSRGWGVGRRIRFGQLPPRAALVSAANALREELHRGGWLPAASATPAVDVEVESDESTSLVRHATTVSDLVAQSSLDLPSIDCLRPGCLDKKLANCVSTDPSLLVYPDLLVFPQRRPASE
jgi:hypothetical protein